MPSRPKKQIEPIHVRELLNGAGMTGFLSLLSPPVRAPHLRELAGPDAAQPASVDGEPLYWLTTRAEVWLGLLARQEQLLRTITEIAFRINGGAAVLERRAQTVHRRHAARFGLHEGRKTQ